MTKNQKKILLRMQMANYNIRKSRLLSTKECIKFYYSDLVELVYSCNTAEYASIINRIINTNSKSFAWTKEQWFPSKMENLHIGLNKKPNDGGARLLLWFANLIEIYANDLNCFIQYRNEFEKHFILGNYDAAGDILDRVEKKYGYSLWLIESRFSVIEYMKGLEGNKEYLEKISSSGADEWVEALSFFYSFKAEKSINNRQYVHRLSSYLNPDSPSVAATFKEKLYPINNIELDEIEYILMNIFNFSLIDIYCSFVKISVRILSDENALEGQEIMVKKALSILKGVDDVVVEKLKYKENIISNLDFVEIDKSFLSASDLYTKGEYEDAIILIEAMMDNVPNCFEMYELYIKAHVMCNKKYDMGLEDGVEIIQKQICEALYSSYVKDVNTPKAYHLLSKLLRLFTNSYFGVGLARFFVDKYAAGNDYILENGKEMVSIVKNITMLRVIPEQRKKTMERFGQLKEKSATVSLYEYYYQFKDTVTEPIDSNRLRWYSIKRKLNKNASEVCEEMCSWYEELKDNPSVYASYQKERISTELFYLLIEEGRYIKAEQVLVDETIRNPYGTIRMDVTELYDRIGIKSEELKKSICTPITAYLRDKADNTEIYTQMANFLSVNNVNKPSDLFGHEDDYGRDRLYYFLEKVCVRDVLDSMFDVFETETEVDNERIEICRFLKENNPQNASNYIEEISQIMQRRKVMEGVKYLEDVKIELDFEKIYESKHELFEDNYKRYVQIGQLSKEYSTIDFSNTRIILHTGGDSEKFSQKYIALKELIEDYRNEFSFGKFGLDPVIGTRIRHGHLQNNIRIAFERNHIAFNSISQEDRTYIPGRDFDELCSGVDSITRSQLVSFFSDFSRRVDEYIDEINKDYLRIRIGEKNPKGLIDLNLTKGDMLTFLCRGPYNDIVLLKEQMELFWKNRLQQGLTNVEEFFKTDAKKFFINALTELENNISLIKEYPQIKASIIDSISRARTDVQKALSQICSWFKLPKEQNYDDYSVTELVEICEAINDRVVPNYKSIKIEKDIAVSSLLLGKTFTYMVDILIILFSNAFQHSGYKNNLQELHISLTIHEEEESLILEMENNLNTEKVNTSEINHILSTMNCKLRECIGKREYYNYEGKSGYLKICKILQHTLLAFEAFNANLSKNDTSFSVTIRMKKESMVLKG